jgi:hypothetical protein
MLAASSAASANVTRIVSMAAVTVTLQRDLYLHNFNYGSSSPSSNAPTPMQRGVLRVELVAVRDVEVSSELGGGPYVMFCRVCAKEPLRRRFKRGRDTPASGPSFAVGDEILIPDLSSAADVVVDLYASARGADDELLGKALFSLADRSEHDEWVELISGALHVRVQFTPRPGDDEDDFDEEVAPARAPPSAPSAAIVKSAVVRSPPRPSSDEELSADELDDVDVDDLLPERATAPTSVAAPKLPFASTIPKLAVGAIVAQADARPPPPPPRPATAVDDAYELSASEEDDDDGDATAAVAAAKADGAPRGGGKGEESADDVSEGVRSLGGELDDDVDDYADDCEDDDDARDDGAAALATGRSPLGTRPAAPAARHTDEEDEDEEPPPRVAAPAKPSLAQPAAAESDEAISDEDELGGSVASDEQSPTAKPAEPELEPGAAEGDKPAPPPAETRTSFKWFNDATLVRYDGELNGSAVELEDLNNCEVILLDVASQVTIDRCTNCHFLIAPTNGSVFIRDCTSCMFTVACRQLRTRACNHCDIFLHTLGPIVETSSRVRFERWNVWYPGQAKHFARAKLDPAVNNWADVYDFNEGDAAYELPHWSLMPPEDFLRWEVRLVGPHAARLGGEAVENPTEADMPADYLDAELEETELEPPEMSPFAERTPIGKRLIDGKWTLIYDEDEMDAKPHRPPPASGAPPAPVPAATPAPAALSVVERAFERSLSRVATHGEWKRVAGAFVANHAASFARGESAADKSRQQALHEVYAAAIEAQLEETLEDLELDATEFMEQFVEVAAGKPAYAAAAAVTLLQVRAMADFVAFCELMVS